MKYLEFDCGCRFPIISEKGKRPQAKLTLDVEDHDFSCKRTWDMIGSGDTKGVFQIESQLGQQLSKRLKPINIEQLSALTAIMRPGCLSYKSNIVVGFYPKKTGGNTYNKCDIVTLFNNKHLHKSIISYDQTNRKLVKNKLIDVVYQGKKDLYKVLYKVNCRSTYEHSSLECTADHRLLTNHGWKELKDIRLGERILVASKRLESKANLDCRGSRKTNAKEQCFNTFEYRCIQCDWDFASLDVNHIDSNNKNNSIENLNYFCPNHHRMFTEQKISPNYVNNIKEQYRLPIIPQELTWAEYLGNRYIENADTYDIIMEAPYHNFIADNVIVHNCMESKDHNGKSVTDRYIDRKNGEEPVTYYHPSLEPALKKTFGELIYQEEAMQIARDVAGFTLQDADVLRKAIGKKKPEEMAKVKTMFLEGCHKLAILNDEQAAEIFSGIEKSQRYSFNKSHAVSYGIVAYLTAYCKAHFPDGFFTGYLKHSLNEGDQSEEIQQLTNNAKLLNIDICPPDIRKRNKHFKLYDEGIFFGLIDIKGIGESAYNKINKVLSEYQKPIEQWTKLDFLFMIAPKIGFTNANTLISSGAVAFLDSNRTLMLYESQKIQELTDKELQYIIEKMLPCVGPEGTKIVKVFEYILSLPIGRGQAISSKPRHAKITGLYNSLLKPTHNLQDSAGWIARTEKQLLGISLTCSEVDDCDISFANCTCKEFLDGHRTNPIIGVKLERIKEITIKNGKSVGKKMAFLNISDNSCSMDATIFSDAYENYKNLLLEGNTILLSGKRDSKRGGLIVDKIWQLK